MAGSFKDGMAALLKEMDPIKHFVEIARLKTARSHADLVAMSSDNGGWLNSYAAEPRLKLVKHAQGTFLVVSYKDGWSTRVSMADFPK